jgi:hypothetical protein
MLNDPDLVRHDIELLADFGADFHQLGAIMGANTFGFQSLMAPDLARQKRIKRFVAAFLAAVTGHLNRLGHAFLSYWRAVRRQRFGFVQKQIALSGIGPGFGLGGIETVQKRIPPVLSIDRTRPSPNAVESPAVAVRPVRLGSLSVIV